MICKLVTWMEAVCPYWQTECQCGHSKHRNKLEKSLLWVSTLTSWHFESFRVCYQASVWGWVPQKTSRAWGTENEGGNHFCYWVSEGNTSGNGSDSSLCFPTPMVRSVTILRTLNCYWTALGTIGVGVHRKICDKNIDCDFVVTFHYIILHLLYHIISYHTISYHIISYHIIYHISYNTISYHIIYHTISYIISYIIQYHISYHIISYHISYHIIYYIILHWIALHYIILYNII